MVRFAGLVLGFSTLAKLGNGQLCHDDLMCKLVGGQCIDTTGSGAAGVPMNCGKSFLLKEFCGSSPSCQCCTRMSCEPSPYCEQYGGNCMAEHDCPTLDGTHRYIPSLCMHDDNPFTEEKQCGCCVPLDTPQPTSTPTEAPTQFFCGHSDKCAILGGKCSKMGECALDKIWDPILCATSSSGGNSNCGCCYDKGTGTVPTSVPSTIPTSKPPSSVPPSSMPTNPPSTGVPTTTPPTVTATVDETQRCLNRTSGATTGVLTQFGFGWCYDASANPTPYIGKYLGDGTTAATCEAHCMDDPDCFGFTFKPGCNGVNQCGYCALHTCSAPSESWFGPFATANDYAIATTSLTECASSECTVCYSYNI